MHAPLVIATLPWMVSFVGHWHLLTVNVCCDFPAILKLGSQHSRTLRDDHQPPSDQAHDYPIATEHNGERAFKVCTAMKNAESFSS